MDSKKFTDLNVILALSFLAIPLLLFIATGEIRQSISNYEYSSQSGLFHLLLSLAGAMFFYNGYVDRSKFYNMVIGASLWGVVLTPHLEYEILHYSFAGLFFIGSIFAMIFWSSGKERFWKILTGVAILYAMAGCFYYNWYSIFWAEWLGMLPISIHYVLESLGKID